MDFARRSFLASMLAVATVFPYSPANAILGLIFRFVFGMGVRRGLAAGAARGIGTTVGNTVAREAARRALISRGGLVVRRQAAAGAPAALKTSRIAPALKTARRAGAAPAIGTGAGSAAASARAEGVPVIDLLMLAQHAVELGNPTSPMVDLPDGLAAFELEVFGINESRDALNGVLSVLVFDEAFAHHREGKFHREVLGLLTPSPGDKIHFVHEILAEGLPSGLWFLVPTVTEVSTDKGIDEIVFEPPSQIVRIA